MWVLGLTDLVGVSLGRIHWPLDWRLTFPLNGLPTGSVRLRLADALAGKIQERDGDVLLKAYYIDATDNVLMFIGELMDFEAIGAGGFYAKRVDRKTLVNQAYSLPSDFPTNIDVKVGDNPVSRAARGLIQAVVPSDFESAPLRQAWVDANVEIRGIPREEITFDPTSRDVGGTLAFNVAGPLWRLQMRLMGTPGGTQSSWTNTQMDVIWQELLQLANDNYETGIQFDTSPDPLYVASVGGDSAWAFKPLGEGYTETQAARVPWPVGTPPVADEIAKDGFDLAGGAVLDGQTEDIGPYAWVEIGAGGNFQTDAGVLKRSANTDDGTDGRWAYVDMPNATGMMVGVDFRDTLGSVGLGANQPLARALLANWDVIADSWARASVQYDTIPAGGKYVIEKRKGGTTTPLDEVFVPSGTYFANDTWFSERFLVNPETGDWTLWVYDRTAGFNSESTIPVAYGQDDDFIAGGDISAGVPGIRDYYGNGAGLVDRFLDNFVVATFTGAQQFDFEIQPIEPTGSPPKIGQLNVRHQIGESKPNKIFEPGRTPVFPTDYIVGDWVGARARNDDGTAAFGDPPIEFRVFEVEVSGDREGRVVAKPTVVPT